MSIQRKIYINALVETERDRLCWFTRSGADGLLEYVLKEVRSVQPEAEVEVLTNHDELAAAAEALGVPVLRCELQSMTEWRWHDVLAELARLSRIRPGTMLLSPALGMITGKSISSAIAQVNGGGSFVSASAVHSMNHPSWLHVHDKACDRREFLVQEGKEATRFIDFSEHLEGDAASFFPPAASVQGSQFLSRIYTVDGSIAYYGIDEPDLRGYDGDWKIKEVETSTSSDDVPLVYRLPVFLLLNQ
ncbi:hypothetical protein [uncultured Pseudodesulfovibrio sp.]|uniref:hypothetical protein n=1 Tax=uncultured Pseudodesulfovibrio sp. TaxID=2035858 RepID=UPI0029C88BEC|nr:hypothetical protein [uncultured Pseudodesulfovibrio sp.]